MADGAVVAGQTDLEIVDATHPLAAGLGAGVKTVYSVADNMGTLAALVPSAKVIAKLTDGTGQATILAIEKGDALNPARIATAPARRVGFFLVDTFANANSDGQKLFDAAVKWAANLGTAPPTLSVARQADGSVTITFTGRLEGSDSLTPPAWQTVPGTGSVNVQPAGQRKFYRAANP